MRVIGSIETKIGGKKRERSVLLGVEQTLQAAVKRGVEHLRTMTKKGMGAGFRVVDKESGEILADYRIAPPEPVVIQADEIDFIESAHN